MKVWRLSQLPDLIFDFRYLKRKVQVAWGSIQEDIDHLIGSMLLRFEEWINLRETPTQRYNY